jgi:hypothetical protein
MYRKVKFEPEKHILKEIGLPKAPGGVTGPSFGIIYTKDKNMKRTSNMPIFLRYVAKVLLYDVLDIILPPRYFSGK